MKDRHRQKFIGALGLICISSLAALSWASTPPESHSFHVHGLATYRCYGGYGAKKDVDSRTKAVCDNQTYKKALIDEIVEIKIKNDPTPDNSKDLAGDWEKDVMYQGRKFTVALTLFKHLDQPSKTPYTFSGPITKRET